MGNTFDELSVETLNIEEREQAAHHCYAPKARQCSRDPRGLGACLRGSPPGGVSVHPVPRSLDRPLPQGGPVGCVSIKKMGFRACKNHWLEYLV